MQIGRLIRRERLTTQRTRRGTVYGASLLAVIVLSSHAGLAQQPDKVSRVGVLLFGSVATSSRYTATLREALRTFGHVDGRNIIIDPRYADGNYERMPALTAELADLKVRVFVAGNERALLAAKATNSGIPIVVVACDPLAKLLGSIARPGGNATGVTCLSADLIGSASVT